MCSHTVHLPSYRQWKFQRILTINHKIFEAIPEIHNFFLVVSAEFIAEATFNNTIKKSSKFLELDVG